MPQADPTLSTAAVDLRGNPKSRQPHSDRLLGSRTNRIIGGSAPSEYLARIEKGGAKEEPIATDMLDRHMRSHCIDPALLHADAFATFMTDREKRPLALIVKATGHSIIGAEAPRPKARKCLTT